MKVIKNNKKIFANPLLLSIMLFYTRHLYSQTDSDQLRLNIQLRPRGEFRNGSITPILEGQQPAAFVSQRTYHHFESAAHVIDYSGLKAGSSLGDEADISFDYPVMKDIKLTGGYSQMFTDPSMKYVKNILPNQSMKSLQNWVWLSININPDILIYKSK